MKIQNYVCESSFPYDIQDVLRDRGFLVESLPEVHHETNKIHGAFAFRVTRGRDTLRVLGVAHDQGVGFHMVDDPSDDPDAPGASDEFYSEIEQIMLTNGADLGDTEEL